MLLETLVLSEIWAFLWPPPPPWTGLGFEYVETWPCSQSASRLLSSFSLVSWTHFCVRVWLMKKLGGDQGMRLWFLSGYRVETESKFCKWCSWKWFILLLQLKGWGCKVPQEEVRMMWSCACVCDWRIHKTLSQKFYCLSLFCPHGYCCLDTKAAQTPGG